VVGIAIERDRQQDEDGFTPEHDTRHEPGELAQAGIAFALAAYRSLRYQAQLPKRPPLDRYEPEDVWPWEPVAGTTGNGPPDFDGDDPVQLLKSAGALIAAEIDKRLAERQALDSDPLIGAHD
jgi:hypothetical protein